MLLNTEKLADGLGILEEFALWLETLKVDAVRFNGFAFSERPDFLHFDF